MAIKVGLEPVHPGRFVQPSILPDGLSITAAAGLLGVGRPGLSTLLNGKASLSPGMALRLEKVFGIKMDTFLKMQTRYDAEQMRQREEDVHVVRFADT